MKGKRDKAFRRLCEDAKLKECKWRRDKIGAPGDYVRKYDDGGVALGYLDGTEDEGMYIDVWTFGPMSEIPTTQVQQVQP